ncbi:hypothetical protein EON63_09655 [archaeon]|nr:MAG: hypothetical protein EON63_09655 [archaeon]
MGSIHQRKVRQGLLEDVPLLQAVINNIKAGKLFDSWGELDMMMPSVFATTAFLSGYCLLSRY